MATYDPVITPTVFYRDPRAAMRWLEKAFDFEIAMLVVDADDNIGHAEMAYRGAVIGIAGEWKGDAKLGGANLVSPMSLDGSATQFIWVKVDDADAHCAKARAAGATITQEPEDQFYGARTYRARDLDGHVWSFSQAVRAVSDEDMTKASGLRFKDKLD